MGKKKQPNATKNVLQVSEAQAKPKGKKKKQKMKRQWKKITFKKSKVLNRDQQVAKAQNTGEPEGAASKAEPYKSILKKSSAGNSGAGESRQKAEATSSATVQTIHNSRV